ncbi:MAG: hypothetical protein Q7R81_03565 [Candidatus Peregrinibacteria bacterium]|nr:hypothetical protein [Candidatus Peregrinibacteria bacterium]
MLKFDTSEDHLGSGASPSDGADATGVEKRLPDGQKMINRRTIAGLRELLRGALNDVLYDMIDEEMPDYPLSPAQHRILAESVDEAVNASAPLLERYYRYLLASYLDNNKNLPFDPDALEAIALPLVCTILVKVSNTRAEESHSAA